MTYTRITCVWAVVVFWKWLHQVRLSLGDLQFSQQKVDNIACAGARAPTALSALMGPAQESPTIATLQTSLPQALHAVLQNIFGSMSGSSLL
jgi:hypothetical protein